MKKPCPVQIRFLRMRYRHSGLTFRSFAPLFVIALFFGCFVRVAAAESSSPLVATPKNLKPEFDRDIRPILAENCYPCHGPDQNKRKAKLRLDQQEGAFKALPNGDFAIVPKDIAKSKLVERISSKDQDEVMPPVKSGKKLTPQQISWLVRWISGGATWQNHWSFVPPHRPPVPAVKHKRWPRNPIDNFVLARLEGEGLKPTREADQAILLRRVSLDLCGLPPAPEQLRTWSRQADALSAAVDELLASPHFGERMASDWMDIARYADTHGFNNDVMRSMWRWRDWVIEAFNRNLPYNQFITEQLAGDLLPSPSLDQFIATGFNRNHGINSEGGIIDEEYRVEYVADRVRTTSIAWLGLTVECARCHDHKFDPVTQKDFYRFFAFFNNIDETGEDGRFANAAPIMPAPTRQQQQEMARQRAAMASAEATMQRLLSAQNWAGVDFENWSRTLVETNVFSSTNQLISLDLTSSSNAANFITNLAGGKCFEVHGMLQISNGPLRKQALLFDGTTDLRTEALPKADSTKGWVFSAWVRRDRSIEAHIFSTANFGVPPSAENYAEGLQVRVTESGAIDVRLAHRWPGYSIEVRTRETLPLGEWQNLVVRFDGSTLAKGLRVVLNGGECSRDVIHDDLTGQVSLSTPAVLGAADGKEVSHFAGGLADVQLVSAPAPIGQLVDVSDRVSLRCAAETPSLERSPAQVDRLRRAWLEKNQSEFATASREFHTARSGLLALDRESPSTMVMRELPQERPTFVLYRGQYDAPRDVVQPDVPEFLLSFPKSAPRNRLGLAKWLTDPANPLTARVVVNRFWQSLFGTGLVKTSENFGYQGELPSHPELLDWLAVDFVESGWDVKRLLRLMVTSATYRQDSHSTPELNERDPENRLLAHGPRQRLTGEMLRDQALCLSGLLHDEIGGLPVFPYQPTNLYKGIVVAADYPGTSYTESSGDGLYRRSLYTFWKRTVPHPTLNTFDVPDREVCTARRPKTNTPLQALATMNDTIQLEAARKLAERMMLDGGATATERLSYAFQLATARKPKAAESSTLNSLLEKRLGVYRKNPGAAKAFISVGASKQNEKLDPVELAAYANLASLILNLDETITRN
jgi:uncharacterized protein DUF1553/uncharacterized protein DUF1549/cytochrome c/concanavalin A-like lectin/glucanase superfamily protein